jgi:hypothetical protein
VPVNNYINNCVGEYKISLKVDIAVGLICSISMPVAYPGIFFQGGGVSINSVEDRGQREQ